jgi:uncharacterized protein
MALSAHSGVLVRTVTSFVVLPTPRDAAVWEARLADAVASTDAVVDALAASGWTVQTRRIVAAPVGGAWDAATLADDALALRAAIPPRFRVSVGAVRTPATCDALADAIVRSVGTVSGVALVEVDEATGGAEGSMTAASARAIARIARETPNGEGNFCFCAGASPAKAPLEGTPFFPAA